MILVLAGCVHKLTMHSRSGDTLAGRYRFARENTGLIEIPFGKDEVLSGRFITVSRGDFVDAYTRAFGTGSIAVDGPDVSSYGSPFTGMLASSHTLPGSAYGETFRSAAAPSSTSVTGPLFYWTASLQSDRGTSVTCFFIGSAYTGHGFGRCKTPHGEEYTADF